MSEKSDIIDLSSLPPLRDVIARYDLRAEKKLGQNFLLDQNITDKIARAAGALKDVTVFEIGPGPGGLTRSLLRAGAKKVVAVEFDPRAVGALQELEEVVSGRLNVIQADALTTDLLEMCPEGRRAIVANLPYNIATPLLVGWLRQIHEDRHAFESMTLMFQREVAERIIAKRGSKSYGRLSVLVQWLCDSRKMFDLPPSAFVPPPKVTSSIIRLVPKTLSDGQPAFEAVEKITGAAFGQRRKMIRSSLKPFEGILDQSGLDMSLRAEQLSVGDFTALASLLV